MATFAKIDENNSVIKVVSVHNNVITDENGEQESLGIEFLKNLYNEPNAKWVQTSYNTRSGIHYTVVEVLDANGKNITKVVESEDQSKAFRANHASLGGSYDPVKDIFVGPKPFSNYVGPNDQGLWDPPITFPSIQSYTDENGVEKFWQIKFDNDNIRWLGSHVKEDFSFDFVWNESNSSWDTLI